MKDGSERALRRGLSYVIGLLSGGLAAILICGVVMFALMGGYALNLNQAMVNVVESKPSFITYEDRTSVIFEMESNEQGDAVKGYCQENGIGCIVRYVDDNGVVGEIKRHEPVKAEKCLIIEKRYSLYKIHIGDKEFQYTVSAGSPAPKGYSKTITYSITTMTPLSQIGNGKLLYAFCILRFPVFVIILALLAVFIKFSTEIPLWPRSIVLASAWLCGEFFVIKFTEKRVDHELVFWAVSRGLLLIAALAVLIGLWMLKKGMTRIAEGDMEYRVNTARRLGYFRETGEILNSISDGMAKAVDDRMRSERLKTELITNVSHDIKTPLTSIINYVDLISREQTDNEKIAEYAQVLTRQSSRLKHLIDDLIEASKAGSGSIEMNPEPVDFRILLSQVVGEYEGALTEKGLNLIVSQPDTEMVITADGRHLARVIDNLMNNIRKYALEGTRVYVDMKDLGDKFSLSFKNTSKYQLNISADELTERFTRGDRSRHTEGSGLGLNIARSLTELMDGIFDIVIDGDLFRVTVTFEKTV